jgi:hypothetical protein
MSSHMPNALKHNKGTMALAGATVLLAFTTSSISGFKGKDTLMERLRGDVDKPINITIKKQVFPFFNDVQPNVVDLTLGKKAAEWLSSTGIRKGAGAHEAAALLNRLISGMKPGSNPADNIRELRKMDRNRVATPEDVFDMKSPTCFQRAILMASALVNQGIDARIVYLKNDRAPADDDYVSHYLVQVMDGGKTGYYCPSSGKSSDSKEGIISAFHGITSNLYINEKIGVFTLKAFESGDEKISREK